MIRTLRLVLLVLVVLITSAAVWVSLYTGAEKKRASEAQNALRRSGEFLQPDTTNDIRFGKPKQSGKPQPATPTPTAP
jgi:cbb3-type cytochrome oxidase subunit 3